MSRILHVGFAATTRTKARVGDRVRIIAETKARATTGVGARVIAKTSLGKNQSKSEG